MNSLLAGYRRLVPRGVGVPGDPRAEGSRPLTPFQAAQADLVRLQAEKEKLLVTYQPAYPAVKRIEREISDAEARITKLRPSTLLAPESPVSASTPVSEASPEAADDVSSVAQLRSQLEANRLEIENLSKDEKRQKELISQYQSRLNLTPVREQQLAAILRDYEISKLDYSDLLGKEQQSQLAMSLEKHQGGQQFRLVDSPSLPALPSSPKRLKISLGGAAAGIALGLALALLAEIRRPFIHTEKEVKQRFSPALVIALPLLMSRPEQSRRTWRRTFEWSGGLILGAVICIAEFYVFRHP
jgi:uncharacterized protein involved in exopolysaccharide biosynthesis